MTNREAVSRLLSTLRVKKDSRIPPRYILRILRSINTMLISQKLLERTIQNDYNLYSSVECFELERIRNVDCSIASFKRCNILMKSKKKLPKLIYSRLGSSIKSVTSIDDGIGFTLVDEAQYRRNKNRKYADESEVYVFQDEKGYVYIPDKEILALNLEFITLETDMLEELSCETKKQCLNAWDSEFIVPDKLVEAVFKEATQMVAGVYAAVIEDSNPNGIDKQPTQ